MQPISPTDSMFLLGESREHPMHVGGLQLFAPPDGTGPDFVREIYDDWSADRRLQPTFRKHPALLRRDHQRGVVVRQRRRPRVPRAPVGAAAPGRVRELLELTSRLHGTLLDRHRPLWEMHLIEGLDDGRFALYTKIHHCAASTASPRCA